MPGVGLDLVCSKQVTTTCSESSKISTLNSWAGRDPGHHPPPILQERRLRLQGKKGLSQGRTVRYKLTLSPERDAL